MNHKIDTILDDCLAQLRAGARLEDCLARYPEHAEALRPLLALALQVQSLPAPSLDRAAINAGRQRMVEAVRARAVRQEKAGPLGLAWLRWPRPFSPGVLSRPLVRAAVSLALVLVIMALSAGGLVAAAQGSLPGDSLYPLKRTAENLRMSLTFDPIAQQQLRQEFDEERQAEVRAVLTAGRSASLEFKGILEHRDTGYWIVAGLRVNLDDQSVVEGRPVVGAVVAVHAESSGDGTLLARRLQIESSPLLPSPTPTRTASPTQPPPTASATSAPTHTPEPTASPTPTPTRQVAPAPSSTATVTPQPQPTNPPAPTETREPETTDHPEPGETEEPEATDHPEPGETEEPEATDHPEPGETRTPESTHQPRPTATDDDEEEHRTPSATRTPQPPPSSTPTGQPESSGRSAVVDPVRPLPTLATAAACRLLRA